MTALYGMGGIGKTQLALAYAHHYRKHYELGWWIPAETEVSVTTALAELAVALGLSAKLPIPELAGRVEELLQQQPGWLLVFDNVMDPTAIARFLPGGGRGHVLLTSRNPAWQGIADPLEVDVLPVDDAVELLRKRSGDSDRHAAMVLAVELGQLPLALEQAAAYVGQYLAGYERPLARYLELFQERRANLLARGRPLAYEGTVDATFTLALDRLRDTSPPAVQLMEMCALLATDELPVHLLLSHPERLPIPLASAAEDSLAREETLGALYQAGLLTPDRGGIARTHRVVQIVTLSHLSGSDRQERLDHTVDLMATLFPDEGWEPRHRSRCVQLLPHARTLLDHATSEQLATPALAELLTVVGRYLWGRRLDLRGAQILYEQSLAINRQLYGSDHPAIARSLGNLASDLRALGEIEQARQLDKQALEMRRRLYEGDHPAIAFSMNNLALDLHLLGEVDQARKLNEQALAMHQRLHEGGHPHVATSLNNLANDLYALGQVEQARDLDVQALTMRQHLYEYDHSATLESLSNLALDIQRLGRRKEARELSEQALAMRHRLQRINHAAIKERRGNPVVDSFQVRSGKWARALDD